MRHFKSLLFPLLTSFHEMLVNINFSHHSSPFKSESSSSFYVVKINTVRKEGILTIVGPKVSIISAGFNKSEQEANGRSQSIKSVIFVVSLTFFSKKFFINMKPPIFPK